MNIIITGASRGIGYETAKIFAAETKNKIIAISRNIVNLNKLKSESECINPNSQVVPLQFDLEKLDRYDVLLKEIQRITDTVDILIHCAGAVVRKPYESISMSEAHQLFDVNFFAPAQLTQLLLPLLGKQNRSHVLNISSIGGFQGSKKFGGLSYYSASKAALACLTECLAEEYKNQPIAFNCLALGAVQTEMLAEAFPGYKAPLEALEMAQFIADFALTGHQFFNGKILPVSMSTP